MNIVEVPLLDYVVAMQDTRYFILMKSTNTEWEMVVYQPVTPYGLNAFMDVHKDHARMLALFGRMY